MNILPHASGSPCTRQAAAVDAMRMLEAMHPCAFACGGNGLLHLAIVQVLRWTKSQVAFAPDSTVLAVRCVHRKASFASTFACPFDVSARVALVCVSHCLVRVLFPLLVQRVSNLSTCLVCVFKCTCTEGHNMDDCWTGCSWCCGEEDIRVTCTRMRPCR